MRKLLLTLTIVLATACGSTVEGDPVAAPDSAPVEQGKEDKSGPRGNTAPDFTVTTFEGERFSLAEQRGTPVVLNFWESW